MRILLSGTAAFGLVVVMLSAVAPGFAQAPLPPLPAQAPPQPPGFVSSYEIIRVARAAGFQPLAPPLREGTTYVLRANDYRGILMRVVLDARTGAIRDANRIVPGPGSDSQLGMLPPYGATPDDMPPPYGMSPQFEPAVTASGEQEAMPQSPRLPIARTATRATGATIPLPRPRPAELAARMPAIDANAGDKAPPQPAAPSNPSMEVKSETPPAASSTPAVTPRKSAPVLPPVND
ncbi:MAG: hypothetical protein ABSE22_05540 [Xanthobacteraceae bacterium]